MKLIEDHQPGVGEFGIVQQALSEQTFGQEFDACARPGTAFEADVVTDGFADPLAALACHEGGGGTCREPPRFEQQDLAPF